MTSRHATQFVIMAGGRGERLWPLVRTDNPKVCVCMDGHTSLLTATLARLAPMARPRDLLIITTHGQADPIRSALPRRFRASLLVEPEPKNTAACIALAAGILARRDPESVMVVLPADHWIQQPASFRRSLKAAIDVAKRSEQLVVIGIRPTRVHPGLGHLRTGSALGRRQGCRIFRLARCLEKPSRRVAQRLMHQHKTYWNAGIFVGRVTTFQKWIRRWLPTHAARLFPLGEMVSRPAYARQARAAYRGVDAISFDHGVMAHVREGYVIEGNFPWEDLGSWDSWTRLGRLAQPELSIASRNVQVLSSNGPVCPDGGRGAGRHLVATVGVEDLIIIHTPDVTLVCREANAQAVRRAVGRLSRNARLARYA